MAEPRSLRRSRSGTKERGRGVVGRIWLAIAILVFYPVKTLLARTRLVGLEHVPAEGGALLVLNHVSHLDPIYDAVSVHRAGRLPRFLAKHTLWNHPVLRGVLRGVEQIPVYRGSVNAQQSLREAHRALEQGKVVLIYPDGTITKDPDGWPMIPKLGVARLALEHDVPVVPVARWGTREIYDQYNKRFRPFPRKRVTLKFGPPVDLSAYRRGEADTRTLREVTELIMRLVRDQLAEIRGERAPTAFYSSSNRGERNDDHV
ncbi:1-acyl-sn-glycerol-3-phosphate acyltransferase [Actinopolyspora erythraea]|uniref:1-acyl-sn-glycerol-3-phosphate acyltransferase n=1 Tax=Actinopolyspora erythraea TaxID=414996 RepID=A0A099D7A0_9ACTN|nr:lysophospholipid acyltransferase family protein [Actinopolyspora erythraea]ASU78093.1 1-acyl-sn-glycerol-3-phosphate acyltransferase [Actinopolyspora erythraea]KGI81702.1 acyl-phosphate glycerol 3-phosphate acyltransferase [Actinopolyspora erythraea]